MSGLKKIVEISTKRGGGRIGWFSNEKNIYWKHHLILVKTILRQNIVDSKIFFSFVDMAFLILCFCKATQILSKGQSDILLNYQSDRLQIGISASHLIYLNEKRKLQGRNRNEIYSVETFSLKMNKQNLLWTIINPGLKSKLR